jgi:hypothetical protein
MFAMIQIPVGLIIAVLAIALAVPLVLNVVGAALGARGAGSRGLRWKAIGIGFGVGIVTTLVSGWLLLNFGAAVLSAPLIGAGVSFAVSRGVIGTEPTQETRS